MTNVVAFTNEAGRGRIRPAMSRPDARRDGTILLFTGVRYVREAEDAGSVRAPQPGTTGHDDSRRLA